MKSLILFIVIANTAYGQSGYTISNRTGTTRTTVNFTLPDFRGATTSTTSSTSGTTSTSTPRYADDPASAYVSDPITEVQDYTPREIGYAEPVYTYSATSEIAPATATDSTVLGSTSIRDWSTYSATMDYSAPREADMYSSTTLFSGVEDTWSGATTESWSSATVDYSGTTVRTDTSTSSTTTSTTTVASTSPTYVEPVTAPTYVEPVTAPTYVEPAPDPVQVATAPVEYVAPSAPTSPAKKK